MISPLLITAIAALIGAGIVAWVFIRTARPAVIGAAVGAVAGSAGALIAMLPLNWCTFEAERTVLDALIGVILIGAGMAAVLLPINWLATRRRAAPLEGSFKQGMFRGWLTPWLLLLPTLVILLLFLYYPFLDTFRLSTLLTFVGAPRSRFICVDNFTRLLNDAEYIRSFGVTFFIAAAIVIIGLFISLMIASVAYQPIRGANIYRTLLIWPYAISPAVAGIIFFMVFNPIAGIANHALNSLFGIKVGWLNDPSVAPWAVILASVWKSLGFSILFYIAGLQNVPNDLREAASIDGAKVWQRFLYITVPMLSPITFFLIITNMTYAFFDIFGTIDTLTAGGPVGSTSVLIYRIYQVGVTGGNIGNAAAQSIILFIMVIALTLVQFRTVGRRVNYGA